MICLSIEGIPPAHSQSAKARRGEDFYFLLLLVVLFTLFLLQPPLICFPHSFSFSIHFFPCGESFDIQKILSAH
jgi:hypothetical protein